jgi:hypothetical protein
MEQGKKNPKADDFFLQNCREKIKTDSFGRPDTKGLICLLVLKRRKNKQGLSMHICILYVPERNAYKPDLVFV